MLLPLWRRPGGGVGIGHLQRRAVAMGLLRLPQQLHQLGDLAGVSGFAGKVVHLVRIAVQVDKLGLVDQQMLLTRGVSND